MKTKEPFLSHPSNSKTIQNKNLNEESKKDINFSTQTLQEAKNVLQMEAQAILKASQKLNSSFVFAAQLISECQSKLIVTGIGKSGHIGKKISSTFTSTGTPSIFLNPSESLHGDLGVISKKDILLVISHSGESSEILTILNFAIRKGIPIIAITGKLKSTLAKISHYCINASIEKEACPLGLAPTSSSIAALSLGDALAMSVLKLKGFKKDDFAEFHPGGSLGKRLILTKNLMHSKEALSLVSMNESLSQILEIMSTKEVKGITGVTNEKGALIGVITDGDLRRFFRKNQSFQLKNQKEKKAFEMMSKNPKTIGQNKPAEEALFLMEKFKIQSLFVTDENHLKGPSHPIGIIHFQDLLKAGLK